MHRCMPEMVCKVHVSLVIVLISVAAELKQSIGTELGR